MVSRTMLSAAFLLCACASAPEQTAPVALERTQIETAPGVSLFVERYGRGPHLVLIPGRMFMPEMAALARPDRTLVLYDMRNRGASSAITDPALISIMHDVEDVEALRRHFGAERVSLVGFSYLGLMTAIYASQHPDRVERLVQIGPVPRQVGAHYPPELVGSDDTLNAEGLAAKRAWETRAESATPDMDGPVLCRLQWAYYRFALVGNPANAARVPDLCIYPNEYPFAFAAHLDAHFGDLQRREVPREDFERLQMPVLTFHGVLDRNAPYGGGREWAETFPNGRLVTVPGGAHLLWLDDAALIRDLDAFFDGAWPERAQRLH